MAFSKKKLKDQRLQRGWTLDDLARRSGLSKSYLSQLESGKERKNPTTKTVEKLARAFQVPPFELMNAPTRKKYQGIAPTLQEFIEQMEETGNPVAKEEVSYLSKLSARFTSKFGAYNMTVYDWEEIYKDWKESVKESRNKK